MRYIAAFAALVLWSAAAQAQVQRSFINLGFEQPALAPDNCYIITSSADVPGWETTHSVNARAGTCTSPAGSAGPSIELWRNLNGNAPRTGLNHAELNAFENSRIYQSVCLASGEVVDWRLSHRGRGGTDVMSFNIDSVANQIVRTSTSETGAGTVVAGSCGSGSVGSASCDAPATVGTWADYGGSFVWNGAAGVHTFGFEAISTGNGNQAAGNFLDQIVVILRPYVEFFPATASTAEGQGSTGVPALRVTGIIEAAFDVQVAITGGTATLGKDFSAPGSTFSVTIPAGDYGTGQDFPLPLSVIDDTDIEGDETVTLAIVEDPTNYVVSSTTTCGGPANAELTWEIIDDDVDLAITKDDGQTAYSPGGTVVYEIVVTNLGPVGVLGAQVGDPLPDGITDASWTCTDDGGGTCGAASGTGAIATTADLPAGASVTYALTMTVPPGFGGDLVNTATVDAPAGMTDADPANNTATDTNTEFTSPPGPNPSVCNIADNGSFESPDIQNDPEGPGDNTAYVNGFAIWRTTTNPISGWETVAGTIDILRHFNNASNGLQSIDLWGTAAATIRQTFTGLVPGAQYTFSVDYSGLSAANSIAVIQLGNGVGAAPVTLATLQPSADAVSNGNAGIPATPSYSVTWGTYRHTFVATGTEATVQFVNNTAPSDFNTGLFIDNFSFAGDPCADLGVVKTATPEEVRSGEAVIYTMQLTNNGPDPANGAIVTDPGVPDSLECTALTCAADAGATCPAAPTPAQLAAGLPIPTFPVGGTVTLELTCTVTATGL
ncbi:DUF642 domain-containing protein [Luteimonas sp. RD2P54]|uniref:DUF642 domain-containing protein n=1 Tax=Luteimonas endophytica TaxID=3042023 RepID=A0ABT6J6Y3_9GAMM|nr:DUF642 domain-containing protein [Luteimonas endophytica]MDH5821963.1 DUF642 domain-containing protein [Luteimonas endophytica]